MLTEAAGFHILPANMKTDKNKQSQIHSQEGAWENKQQWKIQYQSWI